MSLQKLAVAAIAAGLLGCGSGSPRIYKIAVDSSSMDNLPPSCFRGNAVITRKNVETGLRADGQWVIWDGTEKQYLDMGSFQVTLGDTDRISISEVVEGTSADKIFSGQKTVQQLPTGNPSFSSTSTGSVVVKFDDMGNAPTGSIDLSSTYSCTECGGLGQPPGPISCQVKLTFVGRRVDGTNFVGYAPTGSAPGL